MGTPVNDDALDVLSRQARTQNKWLDKPVSNERLLTAVRSLLAESHSGDWKTSCTATPRPRMMHHAALVSLLAALQASPENSNELPKA